MGTSTRIDEDKNIEILLKTYGNPYDRGTAGFRQQKNQRKGIEKLTLTHRCI